MPQLDFLKDLVIVFGAALLVVAVLGRLRVPSIAGYILAGILIGPATTGLIVDVHQTEVLAEVGSADFFDEPRDGQVDMVRAVRSPGSTISSTSVSRYWCPARWVRHRTCSSACEAQKRSIRHAMAQGG